MTQISSSFTAPYIAPYASSKVGGAADGPRTTSDIKPERPKPVRSEHTDSDQSTSSTQTATASPANPYALNDAILRPPSVRSSFSVDPARELKPIEVNPKHAEIRKHYLDIAHYDGNPQIIDTFV